MSKLNEQYGHPESRLGVWRIVVMAILLAGAPSMMAGTVTLAWDASPDTVSGYRVHYGTSSGNYTQSTNVGNVLTATISGLSGGTTYYFAATAFDASGGVSDYSNETLATVPVSNTAPQLTVPGSVAANIETGTAVTGVQVADSTAGTTPLTLTLQVTRGILTVRANVASGVTAGQISGNGAATVVIHATLSALNATLAASNGLLYTGGLNFVGTDTLSLNVNDNGSPALSDTDTVSIQVQGGTQDTWLNQYFTSTDLSDPAKETTVWGDLADPDGDGQNNLMEFALGLDPLTGETTESVLQTGLVDISGQKYASLSFVRRKNEPSLAYIPEVSGDKQTFFSGTSYVVATGVVSLNAEFEVASYQDLTPVTEQTPRFIRLRVVK